MRAKETLEGYLQPHSLNLRGRDQAAVVDNWG